MQHFPEEAHPTFTETPERKELRTFYGHPTWPLKVARMSDERVKRVLANVTEMRAQHV
jgi:hypothetical protein